MSSEEMAGPRWRRLCLHAALFATGSAILTNLVFFISWFYNGGSPHGLCPAPGLWSKLCPTHDWLPIASFVLAGLGKGPGKWQAAGSALAVVFASTAVFVLEMD